MSAPAAWRAALGGRGESLELAGEGEVGRAGVEEGGAFEAGQGTGDGAGVADDDGLHDREGLVGLEQAGFGGGDPGGMAPDDLPVGGRNGVGVPGDLAGLLEGATDLVLALAGHVHLDQLAAGRTQHALGSGALLGDGSDLAVGGGQAGLGLGLGPLGDDHVAQQHVDGESALVAPGGALGETALVGLVGLDGGVGGLVGRIGGLERGGEEDGLLLVGPGLGFGFAGAHLGSHPGDVLGGDRDGLAVEVDGRARMPRGELPGHGIGLPVGADDRNRSSSRSCLGCWHRVGPRPGRPGW